MVQSNEIQCSSGQTLKKKWQGFFISLQRFEQIRLVSEKYPWYRQKDKGSHTYISWAFWNLFDLLYQKRISPTNQNWNRNKISLLRNSHVALRQIRKKQQKRNNFFPKIFFWKVMYYKNLFFTSWNNSCALGVFPSLFINDEVFGAFSSWKLFLIDGVYHHYYDRVL